MQAHAKPSVAGSKLVGVAWVIVAVAIAIGLVSSVRPLAHAVPWAWEVRLHNVFGDERAAVCATNPQVEAVRAKLLRRIYPLAADDRAVVMHVRYIKNDEINAFASLGGNISVNSGLLKKARSPDELAGVLAHEIAHVTRRHVIEGFAATLATRLGLQVITGGDTGELASALMSLNFSRGQELEADQAAFLRLDTAHVDNRALQHLFLHQPDSASFTRYLSDHPLGSERAKLAARYTNRATTPVLTPSEWHILQNGCT